MISLTLQTEKSFKTTSPNQSYSPSLRPSAKTIPLFLLLSHQNRLYVWNFVCSSWSLKVLRLCDVRIFHKGCHNKMKSIIINKFHVLYNWKLLTCSFFALVDLLLYIFMLFFFGKGKLQYLINSTGCGFSLIRSNYVETSKGFY